MSWRRKWALAGCKMYNKLEYTKAKRLLDRGYDDKDHRTFIDIELVQYSVSCRLP
jgi:hypothetical protein